jgi:hypothetical protein
MTDQKDNDGDERGTGHSTWRIAELLFGGGVIVWALATTLTSVWWAATIDARVAEISKGEESLATQLQGLDNVSLGNRITAIETQMAVTGRQLDAIDKKLDRVLQRRGDLEPN